MPWQLFEKLYGHYLRRKKIEELKANKNAIMTGIIANTNLDGEHDEKGERLRTLDDDFKRAMNEVMGIVDKSQEIDYENDPFFAAMRLPEGAGRLAELGKDTPTMEDVESIAVAAGMVGGPDDRQH